MSYSAQDKMFRRAAREAVRAIWRDGKPYARISILGEEAVTVSPTSFSFNLTKSRWEPQDYVVSYVGDPPTSEMYCRQPIEGSYPRTKSVMQVIDYIIEACYETMRYHEAQCLSKMREVGGG